MIVIEKDVTRGSSGRHTSDADTVTITACLI
jgi:hypothetical protein